MTLEEIQEKCGLDLVLFGAAFVKLNSDGTIEYIDPLRQRVIFQHLLLTKEKKMENNELDLLKKDINDLLNQVVVKLKDVEAYEAKYDDDGFPVENEQGQSLNYLSSVKSYCERVLQNESSASWNEDKYYDSRCF